MASLPPVNATLTEVRRQEGWDDLNNVAVPGAVRWQGNVPAYATENVIVETGRGTVEQLVVTRLVIPSRIAVSSGDDLTFIKGGQATTRRARNIEDRSDRGFVRIYFYDA